MEVQTPGVPPSAVALLAGAIDYAGLFPPASLELGQAVAEYGSALQGLDAWMLGRFVIPATRLAELDAVCGAAAVAPTWRLSAIVGEGAEADLAAISACNASRRSAVVDAIECKPQHLEGIDWLADRVGDTMDVYVETAPDAGASGWLERIAKRGLRAKLRTGGTTAAAFPDPEAVLTFLAIAVGAGLRFKATAGLHHALRGSYRLTYDEHAVQAPMYGYVNLLLATVALRMGSSAASAGKLLLCSDAGAISFGDDAVRYNGVEFPNALLRSMRARHLVAFGSCSFREPVEELRQLVSSAR